MTDSWQSFSPQALKNFQRLHVAVAALGVLCLLALSSALGRGLAPLSPVPAATSAGTD